MLPDSWKAYVFIQICNEAKIFNVPIGIGTIHKL